MKRIIIISLAFLLGCTKEEIGTPSKNYGTIIFKGESYLVDEYMGFQSPLYTLKFDIAVGGKNKSNKIGVFITYEMNSPNTLSIRVNDYTEKNTVHSLQYTNLINGKIPIDYIDLLDKANYPNVTYNKADSNVYINDTFNVYHYKDTSTYPRYPVIIRNLKIKSRG